LHHERLARIAAEQAAERLVKLQAFTATLSRLQRVEDVAEATVAHLPAIFGAEAGVVFVLEGAALAVASRIGTVGAPLLKGTVLDEGWLASRAARTDVPLWYEDAKGGPVPSPHVEAVVAAGVRAGAFLPLRSGGRVIGVLALGFRDRRAWSDAERAFTLAIADLCAQALGRALAHAEAERAAERTSRLQQVTAAFSEALTPRDVTAVAAGQGCAALGATRSFVCVLAEGGAALEVVATIGYPDAAREAWRTIPLEVSVPLTDAVRLKAALFFGSRADAMARYPPLPHAYAPEDQAFAAVPLVVDGRVLGALSLVWDAARRFDPEEQSFILALTRLCAQALERARLYDALARARADAEAAGRARDDFLANVSHELRTPLTAILGWANLLQTRAADPAATRRALATIERNAVTQVRLVEDLLDVSRIASGKIRLDLGAVDAAAAMRAALDGLRPAAEHGGVQLEAELDADAGVVAADPVRLQQIAQNLLGNAVKFTPRGGRVTLRLERRADRLVISVRDSGKGIDGAFLPHVFERFRQVESGSARAHGGLGLGLAIVKHLVELHDGTIRAESGGLGRGATFVVTLPARSPESPAEAPVDGGPPPEPRRLDGVRVLVVEDHADARDLIASILQGQGATVVTAGSAAEALRAFTVAAPEVLLSDIGMPDEDGYALLRRVRARSAVPAVALTAYAGTEDARMAELAGFDRYLAKPVVPEQLIDAVARLSGRG
jgi:hypothetical protein